MIRWTKEQEERLRELAGTLSGREIGKVLGLSKSAVLVKIKKLGLKGLPEGTVSIWTEEDFVALKRKSRDVKLRDWARAHGKSESGTQYWANRIGVETKGASRWSEAQKDALRLCKTADEAMSATGRSNRAVHKMANLLGIKFARKTWMAANHRCVAPGKTKRDLRSNSSPTKKMAKPKRVQAFRTRAVEYCPECYAPVSNWGQHYERMGHGRIA